MAARTKMILWGGEKDGWETEISPADRPDVFYVVPHSDEHRLQGLKSNQARLELRAELAVLAYKYDPEHLQSTSYRFIMTRTPALDRVNR
jgi:hypothetical protein